MTLLTRYRQHRAERWLRVHYTRASLDFMKRWDDPVFADSDIEDSLDEGRKEYIQMARVKFHLPSTWQPRKD